MRRELFLLLLPWFFSLGACASTSQADRILVDQTDKGLGVLEEVLGSSGVGQGVVDIVVDLRENASTLAQVIGRPDGEAALLPYDREVSARAREQAVKAKQESDALREQAGSWAGTLAALGLGSVGAALLTALRYRKTWLPALSQALHVLNSVKHATERGSPIDVPRMLAHSREIYGGKSSDLLEQTYAKYVQPLDDIARTPG